MVAAIGVTVDGGYFYTHTNTKIEMKTSTALCAILAIAASTQILFASTNTQVETAPDEEYCLEDNEAIPSMFFTSEGVVEEYEYDNAYVVVYDDADANMFNVEICVDLETYQMCIEAHKTGHHFTGSLVLSDDYATEDVPVFTYIPEPEYEMAAESAKRAKIFEPTCLLRNK